MLAPLAIASLAISALVVSILMVAPSSLIASITGMTRALSSSALMRDDPGRVDSPPTSIIFTPSATIASARATASVREKWRPPSAKESGVTLRMPITKVS